MDSVHSSTLISIHAPAWGATSSRISIRFCGRFQSTLPRGERLLQLVFLCGSQSFQSTLPRGERRKRRGWSNGTFDFNPRSRVGSDQWKKDFFTHFSDISIHAPAWGATLNQTKAGQDYLDFNPRSRVGSDRACTAGWMLIPYFNPRSRVGSDIRRGA